MKTSCILSANCCNFVSLQVLEENYGDNLLNVCNDVLPVSAIILSTTFILICSTLLNCVGTSQWNNLSILSLPDIQKMLLLYHLPLSSYYSGDKAISTLSNFIAEVN